MPATLRPVERLRTLPIHPWLVLATVATAIFMATLDASIVNVALPVIAERFQADLPLTQWVVSAYFLTISSLLLLFGRIGDMHGRRLLYAAGFLLFTMGSALCGAAGSMGGLIASRVVQAVGASVTMALSPALVLLTFPGPQRGRALGMTASVVALGSLAGPGIGGILLGWLGWRAIFLVNIPVGLAGSLLALLLLPPDSRRSDETFDYQGALLFSAGLTGLLLVLSHGREWGWASTPTLGCGAAAALLLPGFIRRERRTPHPMLDLTVFRHRPFRSGIATGYLAFMAMITNSILLPFYLADFRGLPPTRVGLLLTPFPLVMAMVSPLSGYLSERVSQAALATTGLAFLSLGLAHNATLAAASGLWRVALGQVVLGIGAGLFLSPNNNAILSSAPPGRAGIAGGMLALVRNLGMVSGVAVAVTVFETVRHLAAEPDGQFISAFRAALLAGGCIAAAGAMVSGSRLGRSTEQPRREDS